MLGRMSAREISQWQAYEQVSGPLGQERQDVLASMTAFYVVKALGGKKSKVRLDKMLPRWDRPKQMPWQQMRAFAEALTRQHAGDVNVR